MQTKSTSRAGNTYNSNTKTDTLSVVFDGIKCEVANNTETYIIKEVIPQGAEPKTGEDGKTYWVADGVTYDDSEHEVKIKTTDDQNGQLHAEVIYTDGQMPSFTNEYFGAEANISFDKEYYGANSTRAPLPLP